MENRLYSQRSIKIKTEYFFTIPFHIVVAIVF